MTPAEESAMMIAEGWVENWLEKELESHPDFEVCKQNLDYWKTLVEGIKALKKEIRFYEHKVVCIKNILK